ncbi:MAG: hypothetical protein U5J97_00550 [Trueperaceae bacterium]|nr:hypothetical protein [Trueperaceae bacterium]
MRRRPLPFVATDLLLAVAAAVLLLAGCGASTPVQDSGPELELVANGSGQWYVTSPDADLTAFDALRIVVVLENGTGADTTFVGDEEPQIWTTPSVVDPPVTFQVVPSGTFPAGALFAYDLTVDLSGLPPGETGLAFRPYSFTNGTMSPSKAVLVAASVTVE